jgi:hypothetical protein
MSSEEFNHFLKTLSVAPLPAINLDFPKKNTLK